MMQRTGKRIWAMILALLLVLGLMTAPALAASKTTGKCGKSAKWSYNKKTRTLTISGKGSIKESDWPEYNKVNLVIKKGITGIKSCAFCDMDVRKLSLPSTLTSIGSSAFWGGQGGDLPATFTIPKSVEKIGFGAFSSCEHLKNIKVEKGNKSYVSVNGVLFSKDKTQLLSFPAGKKGTYNIPKGTKVLAVSSFGSVALKELTVPASVTKFATGVGNESTTIKTIRFQGRPPKGLLDWMGTDDYVLWANYIYYPKEYEKEWKSTKKKYLSNMNDGSADWDEELVIWRSY